MKYRLCLNSALYSSSRPQRVKYQTVFDKDALITKLV